MKEKDREKEKKPKELSRESKDVKSDDLPERRGFLVSASAAVIGGVVGLVPAAAGLAVFVDPLNRKSQVGQFIKVADLKEVPADSTPRPYQVIMDRSDAWNLYPREPVGVVYLWRHSDGDVPHAVTATCPHLGCFVDFQNGDGKRPSVFQCPCHDSKFEPDGKRIDPDHCPAARDLDTLDVEVRDQEVWVKFQKFIGGREEKTIEA